MDYKTNSCLRLSTFQPEVDLLDFNAELVSSPPIHFNQKFNQSAESNSLIQLAHSQSCVDVNGNAIHDCCKCRRLSTARSVQSLKIFGSNLQSIEQIQLDKGDMTLGDKLTYIYQQSQLIIGDQLKRGTENGTTTRISNLFYDNEMHELHPLQSEDEIQQVLKFLIRSSPSKNTFLTATEHKRLHHLRSALFKECGFTIKASVVPIMCFKKKKSFFKNSSMYDLSSQKLTLLILLCVRNRQQNLVFLDCHGRVYKDMKDWEKNNTLPPSNLVIPLLNPSSPEAPFTLKIIPSPSSTPAKKALDVCDITMGIGALSAGVACIVFTGGTALPFLLAGELVATMYMSVRATTSIANAKKHRPKLRR